VVVGAAAPLGRSGRNAHHRRQVVGQHRDRRQLHDVAVVVHVLVFPRHVVRDVHGVAADGQHREHVAADRVADHAEAFGRHADGLEDACVGLGVLLVDDLHVVEVVGEPRRGDLALLVDQVAFRDEDQAVIGGNGFDGFWHAVEQSHLFGQHLMGEPEQLTDHGRRHRGPGRRDGTLDHRQHERLDPVARDREVGDLGRPQRVAQVDTVWHMRRHQFDEPVLHVDERVLAVPQRVVGIEGDDVEGGAAPSSRAHRWMAFR